jgi:glycosyltransferase involved in cell wall biosynthesis
MPSSLRHLHFTQSLEPLEGGGLGRAALDLHLQLHQEGFVSRLFTTRAADFHRQWPEVFQYPRSGPQKAFFSWGLRQEAACKLANVDVVHGHGFYVYPNWAVGTQARRQGKPLVYHPQGMFEPWILQRSRLKKRLVLSLFDGENMAQCRLWRALSDKEAGQIRRQGFEAPIVVAPNGVRLEELDAALPAGSETHLPLTERARQRKRLVFMARLHPKKGLDLLLPAWSRLQPHLADWELLVAGPDEGGYRATVEGLIRELDLNGCVTLTGPVTGPSKLALLRSADVFVLPSYSEGVPVAVLEAMACRVPAVVTRESNIPELEKVGGGWLCAANAESLCAALGKALNCSEAERKVRGQTARALVEKRYTWCRIAASIREACERYCG